VLVTFLQYNLDVFTWKILDILGIPREVIEHKLGVDPSFKPIKQKDRRYTAERHETIRQEDNRLLEVGFIKPVDYPSWLANKVLVEKSDASWRMCIDSMSFNKVCPKDEYLLPRICQIVDSTSSCELLSWMPIWAIIKSALSLTTKKTSFITPFGVFCHTTMGELHIIRPSISSWKVKSDETLMHTLMMCSEVEKAWGSA
jgi:hypothetical protein